MVNYTTILVLIYVLLPSMSYANFFEQRYRGWLWFEEKMIEQDMMSSEQPSNDITPEQAKEAKLTLCYLKYD